jgi:hypothetical protein
MCAQRAAGDDVSFVFSCQVAGKSVSSVVFQPRKSKGGGSGTMYGSRGRGVQTTGVGRAAGVKRPAAVTAGPALGAGVCGAPSAAAPLPSTAGVPAAERLAPLGISTTALAASTSSGGHKLPRLLVGASVAASAAGGDCESGKVGKQPAPRAPLQPTARHNGPRIQLQAQPATKINWPSGAHETQPPEVVVLDED